MRERIRNSQFAILNSPSPWRRRGLPLASALLLWLAFPPLDLFPIAFVALVPLCLYLAGPDTRWGRAVAVLAGGLAFYGIGFSWIRFVTVVGWWLLAAYAAFYWLLFAALAASWRGREGAFLWPFRLAAAWAVLEYIRANLLTGIPWFMVGHSQIDFLALAQIADLAGVPGVTFLVVLVNAGIAHEIVVRRQGRSPRFPRPTASLAAAVLLTGAGSVYGRCCVLLFVDDLSMGVESVQTPSPDVLLVQGNIEQSVKKGWLHADEIYDIYARLTREACVGGAGSQPIVVWPETMFPPVREEYARVGAERGPLSKLRALAPASFLVGVHVSERPFFGPSGAAERGDRGREWNAAVSVDPDGRVAGRYDKRHLVPVGEYFPFRGWALWDWMVRQGTGLAETPNLYPGESLDPVPCGGWKLGALICYENAFPEIACEEVRRGAHILVNLSNEAWYEDSAEFEQMLAMARFRCIETRTGMARATNSGISAIIDPGGRVLAAVKDGEGRWIQVRGALRGRVPVGPRRSLYLALGDWFVAVCGLGLLADLVVAVMRARRTS